ncbi:DUF1326 domain-containing protein [Arthrobacter sp. MMS18-M83]|uniref:DUF1326 domain-containing protein n=1 Tax=Arthrobacter sp. MMS18-M83 TaxID=2996261 RepID=UPI00227A2A94|nr:DUF1326 domain-containing protein [Arthrobacter sp. MMS18-M83]WAH98867.1 DUF1326 domain-containing protein [Arthrobacter sp. MMS18-M83]
MSWEMSGKYVANCSCALICPCPVDGRPNSTNGECRGVAVFHVAAGKLDDTDLSGVDFAFVNFFPSHLTAGGWRIGVVLDEGASDGQATALESILHGEVGGPFGDLAALYGEWLGVQRASVTFSDGDNPSGKVGDRVNFTLETLPGPGGGVTTVKNAMYAFAADYMIGKAPGHSDLFDLDFDGIYGESGEFTYASEMAEGAPKGRA